MNLPTERPKIPNSSLPILLRLAKTLLHGRPTGEQADPIVDKAAARLAAMVADADRALSDRLRESNAGLQAIEVEFDRAVDKSWVWLRVLLEGYRDAFGHAGLDALPEPLAAQADLAELRRLAALAGRLHSILFSAEGTKWVTKGWQVQAEASATLLRLIEEDDLAGELEQIAGPKILGLLRAAQVHYEDIANARLRRSKGRRDDFHELRAKLRWHIDRYRAAVETLYDLEDPRSFAIVDEALRPLDRLVAKLRAGASSAQVEALADEEFVVLELPSTADADSGG